MLKKKCTHDYYFLTGDSGTGLFIQPQNKFTDKRTVVGVTSFGISCQIQFPSFYTRVTEYLDWIKSIVWA